MVLVIIQKKEAFSGIINSYSKSKTFGIIYIGNTINNSTGNATRGGAMASKALIKAFAGITGEENVLTGLNDSGASPGA